MPCDLNRLPQVSRGSQHESVKTAGRILVTDFGTMLGACLAGVEIARIKAIGIQDLLAQKRPTELLPDWNGETFPLYALYPSNHLLAAKVRAFIDFVVEVTENRA
jgi:DNA-binding transcriptional LysR family regulator